jgi:hypothetical protein
MRNTERKHTTSQIRCFGETLLFSNITYKSTNILSRYPESKIQDCWGGLEGELRERNDVSDFILAIRH